ncbi:MAG: LemA family protein [Rivularia sp. (in: cyanobacteria)]
MIWLGLTNNSLNHAAIAIDAKWAQVENQMQRRADLIPNLTNITQAYAEQELNVIRSLTSARLAYLKAISPEEKVAANRFMLRAIEQFTASATANPKLQSSELFINLQYEIAGTENRIATERRRYNQAVTEYNQSLSSFPTLLIAKPLGFQTKPFLQANSTNKN